MGAAPPALGVRDAPGAMLPELVKQSWALYVRAGTLECLCMLSMAKSTSCGVRALASLTSFVAVIGNADGGARLPISVSFEPDLTGCRIMCALALIPASARMGDIVCGNSGQLRRGSLKQRLPTAQVLRVLWCCDAPVSS